MAYFTVYVYYNARARVRLEKLPYNRFRTGNLLQNWQVSLLIGVLRWSRVLLQLYSTFGGLYLDYVLGLRIRESTRV